MFHQWHHSDCHLPGTTLGSAKGPGVQTAQKTSQSWEAESEPKVEREGGEAYHSQVCSWPSSGDSRIFMFFPSFDQFSFYLQ